MNCATPNICDSQDLFQKCPSCQILIEEAAIQSALNMGVPDWFGCGICGGRFSPKDFAEHMAAHANT